MCDEFISHMTSAGALARTKSPSALAVLIIQRQMCGVGAALFVFAASAQNQQRCPFSQSHRSEAKAAASAKMGSICGCATSANSQIAGWRRLHRGLAIQDGSAMKHSARHLSGAFGPSQPDRRRFLNRRCMFESCRDRQQLQWLMVVSN